MRCHDSLTAGKPRRERLLLCTCACDARFPQPATKNEALLVAARMQEHGNGNDSDAAKPHSYSYAVETL
jgi:hypothetical protein